MSIWADKENIKKWISEACISNSVPDLVPQIKYQFNNRFKSRLGDANLKTNVLRFSAVLWNKATPEQKQNTVKHETSHLITHKLYGKVPHHGSHWKQVMLRAGQIPTRTHNVQSVQKTIDVICTGCKQIIKMGLRRYARMRNGQRYLCRNCNSAVEFVK